MVAWAQAHLPSVDRVICSDLVRARQMGERLAEVLQVPLVVDVGLREQHMGDWEGRLWKALTAEDVVGVRAFWTDYAHTRPPGGESLGDLDARVADALGRHWPSIRGGRTVVAAHAGVVRVMLCRMLGLPLTEALRFAPVPGSHTWLQLAQAGVVVQTLGERPLASDPGVVAAAQRADVRPAGKPKVALCGSAGTGKTTLGRALSKRLGVPYIPEGMRERIEGGLDVRSLSHAAFRALVVELWEEQCAREDAAVAAHGGFVSDRSPLDFTAFRLVYAMLEEPELDAQLAEAVRRVRALDRLVVLPFGVLPLVDDGVRSPRKWVQRRFQSTVEGLVMREAPDGVAAFMPPLTALSDRVAWVCDLLTESGTAPGFQPSVDSFG